MMNTSVGGERSDTAAILALASGARIPSERTDEAAYQADSERVERDVAGVVFERRTGVRARVREWTPRVDRPSYGLVHLGLASLKRRGIADSLVGAAIRRARPDCRVAVFGNADTNSPARRAALFGIDDMGLAYGRVWSLSQTPDSLSPFGVRDDPVQLAELAQANPSQLTVIQLGDGARAEVARAKLTHAVYREAMGSALSGLDTLLSRLAHLLDDPDVTILVISPRPPAGKDGAWDRLTPIIMAGKSIHSGLLVSATTRTLGIVANVDVAPTILSLLGVQTPPAMIGRVIHTVESQKSLGEVERIDRLVHVSADAQTRFFALVSFLAAIFLFGGMAAVRHGSGGRIACLAAFGSIFILNMPLAMLLVVPLSPETVPFYFTGTLAIMLAMTTCEILLAHLARSFSNRKPNIAAPILAGTFLSLAVLLDTLFGQSLVKLSVFSAYPLQGFRFYGIGNEYMGVLVAATLLFAFHARIKPPAAALLFGIVAFILGWPGLGANAGGLIGATTGFGVGWISLREIKPGWRHAAAFTLLGVALAFGFALIDRAMGTPMESHFGGTLTAAGKRGYGYLWEIVVRKVAMNIGFLMQPNALIALSALAMILVLARVALKTQTVGLLKNHPEWARCLPAAVWGSTAAFLFNDSGIVAALFLFGTYLVTGICFLLSDSPVPANHSVHGHAAPRPLA